MRSDRSIRRKYHTRAGFGKLSVIPVVNSTGHTLDHRLFTKGITLSFQKSVRVWYLQRIDRPDLMILDP